MAGDSLLSSDHIWGLIPVFNNRDTVKRVVLESRTLLKNMVVVDDGSTDVDVASLFAGTDIHVIRHDKNQGKGRAILSGLQFVRERGGQFMITLDADGQHYPRDILKFVPLLQRDEPVLVVGCRNFDAENVPDKSRFGRKFANFWLRIETGLAIDDCQSGFRAYPVEYIAQLGLTGSFYDFEAEVLAKAAWAGVRLETVSVDVWYPEAHLRVSSFRPFLDNFRLSCMHTRLVGRRLLPIPHARLAHSDQKRTDARLLLHPIELLKTLLKEHATPEGLAAAAAVGTFVAVLPLMFLHTLAILYVATRLHLNKVMAVSIQHLCMPPVVPLLCIEAGYYMRNGQWLTEVSFQTVFAEMQDRALEWLLGSLLVAPFLAVVTGLIVYQAARIVAGKVTNHAA